MVREQRWWWRDEDGKVIVVEWRKNCNSVEKRDDCQDLQNEKKKKNLTEIRDMKNYFYILYFFIEIKIKWLIEIMKIKY